MVENPNRSVCVFWLAAIFTSFIMNMMDVSIDMTYAGLLSGDDPEMFAQSQPSPLPVNLPCARSVQIFDIKLTKFTGYSNENVEKFLTAFESYVTLNDLQDARIMAAFHLHLAGPALVWYNGLPSSVKMNWFSLKQLFTNQYACTSDLTATSMAESAAFDSLILQPSQALEDFHSNIYEKGTRLKKPASDLITKFINGLPAQLAFFVRARQVKDYLDALNSAKLGEAYGYRASPRPANVVHSLPQPVVNAVGDPVDQLKSALHDVTSRLSRLEMSRMAKPPPTSTTQRPQMPGPVRNRNPNIRCYTCDGLNHTARFCNWTGKGPKLSEVQCQICMQTGHSAQSCKRIAVQYQGNNHGLGGVNNRGTPRAGQHPTMQYQM